MGAGVRPEIDPLEQLKALKAPAAHADPLEQLKAMKPVAPTNYDGSTPVSNAATSALDGLTFGLSKKLIAGGSAAIDAAQAKAEGKPFFDTLGQAYKQDLHAQEAGADQYHAAHPVMDTAAQLAGGGLGIAATGGLGAAKGALQAGRLARYGKAIGTGAAYGAASAAGHSDAVENGQGPKGLLTDALRGGGYGAAAGAASIPVSAVGGKILSALHVPQGLSSLAGAVSRVAPDGSGLQRGAQAVGEAFGAQGPAAQTIARLSQMDADAGFVPPSAKKAIPTPLNKNLPRQMGTPMDGYTTAPLIPRTTGDPSMGGEPVTDMAIPARPGSRVVPNLSKYKPAPMALDEAGPNVQGFAEQMAHRPGEAGARIQTAVKGRLTAMRPSVSGALGDATDLPAGSGLGPLQKALDARTAEAKTLYDAARASTQGQAISSPTFDEISKTKAGAQALKAAMQRQGNMFRENPTAGGSPPGMSPEQWRSFQATMKERGQPMPPGMMVSGDTPQADPETLHIMKQQLSKMAKLGSPNDPLTAEAFSLLPMIEKVKGELPDTWRQADAAFAARSRLIDMMDRGRQVFNTKQNPSVTGPKALNRSLDGLRDKAASASPEERDALQTGAAIATRAKLDGEGRALKSPGRVFDFTSPEKAEQLGYAFPSPAHADEFRGVSDAWDKAEAQKETMLGNSATARRGAFQNEKDIVRPGSIVGRPRMILRSLINGLDDEHNANVSAKMQAEAAKILTSPNPAAIGDATRAGMTRGALLQALRLGAAGDGGAAIGKSKGPR